MRLIDADALKKTLEDAGLGEHSLIESVLAAGVYAVIDNAPTIDAVPVVHSRWVKTHTTEENVWNCSACGYPVGIWTVGSRYCPNCGAKMRGETDAE